MVHPFVLSNNLSQIFLLDPQWCAGFTIQAAQVGKRALKFSKKLKIPRLVNAFKLIGVSKKDYILSSNLLWVVFRGNKRKVEEAVKIMNKKNKTSDNTQKVKKEKKKVQNEDCNKLEGDHNTLEI